MKRIPTFRLKDKVLTGAEARKAWASQNVRCACGDYGDVENTIAGSCNDMPAEWLGCPNCSGTALGRPMIFRLPSHVRV